MKLRFIGMILLGALLNNCIAAENTTQISRYMTVKNRARFEQMDLMAQIVQIRFPQNVKTIGEAVNYILRFSGFALSDCKNNQGLRVMLSKPLPLVDRDIGPISLREALLILVGPGFTLETDSINREVNFKLKENYYHFVKRGQA